MPGTHSKNDSDQTGSQPRSSFIVHRSSSVRPSVRSLLIRRTESSCFKLSIVYPAGILRSLRTLRPRVSTYLPTAHPSAADIADIATLQSLEHEHEHEHECPGGLAVSAEHRVIMIRVRRRRAGGPGRVGSGKARRREGPGERKTDGEGGYGTRENTELTLTLRGRRAQEIDRPGSSSLRDLARGR